MKDEIAAILRALRSRNGARYQDLADVSAQANLSRLEQGKNQITFAKLAKLADALEFDIVALVALAASMERRDSPLDALAHAHAEIAAFIEQGGLELVSKHFDGDKGLVQRGRGKPSDPDRIVRVLELKAKGLSKSEVSRELGIPESTVRRYWMKG